jgi:hypothetical protein
VAAADALLHELDQIEDREDYLVTIWLKSEVPSGSTQSRGMLVGKASSIRTIGDLTKAVVIEDGIGVAVSTFVVPEAEIRLIELEEDPDE